MIDIEQVLQADADQWQRAVDSGARPKSSERSSRHRPLLLAASGAGVVAAIVGATLAVSWTRHASPSLTPHDRISAISPAVPKLSGVTWSDPHSLGTLIFGATTVNVSDGCSDGLRVLRLRVGSLTIGAPVGQQSVCSGLAGGPPAGQLTFDRVVQGRLRWSLSGRRLTLSRPGHGSLTLVRGTAPAPSVTGQRWQLSRVDDTDHELNGSFDLNDATFVIRDGRLHASDLCNEISADANTTPTTIVFSHVTTTASRCGMPLHKASARLHATAVIDSVLRGTRTYLIRAGQLYLYGPADDLIYSRSS